MVVRGPHGPLKPTGTLRARYFEIYHGYGGARKDVKLTRLGPLVRVNIGNNKDVSLPAAPYSSFRGHKE